MVMFTALTSHTEQSLRSAVLKDSTWKAHVDDSRHPPGLAESCTWKAPRHGSVNRMESGVDVNLSASVSMTDAADQQYTNVII